jgi:hypothetical protein
MKAILIVEMDFDTTVPATKWDNIPAPIDWLSSQYAKGNKKICFKTLRAYDENGKP